MTPAATAKAQRWGRGFATETCSRSSLGYLHAIGELKSWARTRQDYYVMRTAFEKALAEQEEAS